MHSEIFWSVFSRIRIQHGDLQSKSLYSVRMRENEDQKNSELGTLFTHGSTASFLLISTLNISPFV